MKFFTTQKCVTDVFESSFRWSIKQWIERLWKFIQVESISESKSAFIWPILRVFVFIMRKIPTIAQFYYLLGELLSYTSANQKCHHLNLFLSADTLKSGSVVAWSSLFGQWKCDFFNSGYWFLFLALRWVNVRIPTGMNYREIDQYLTELDCSHPPRLF